MNAKYSQKVSISYSNMTWEVMPNGLSWTDDKGGSGFFEPQDIKTVRLCYETHTKAPNRVGMHIYADKHYLITDSTYGGIAYFHQQKPQFKAFVMAFHKLFEPDGNTQFLKGTTKWGFILKCIVAIYFVGFISAMSVGSYFMKIESAYILLLLIPAAILAAVSYKFVGRNKPSTYQPDKIPAEFF